MNALRNISLTIDEKALGYAKIYASLLESEYQRKRAYAEIAALYAFINTLEKTDNIVQKSMTLFRNPLINQQYEISDLYVNNYHLNIRVITEGETFFLPKIHFESNILPDFYVVIKLDKEIKKAELLGFLDKNSIIKKNYDENYYTSSAADLLNYAEFLERIKEEKVCNFSKEDHDFVHENYIAFMDNELDNESKNKILQHLFNCSECRTEFCCFTGFEMVSADIKRFPELLQDETLLIIGSQNTEAAKYKDKEETIYIGNNSQEEKEEERNEAKREEPKEEAKPKTDTVISQNTSDSPKDDPRLVKFSKEEQETSSADNDETVSDILDELFNSDEDLLQYEDVQEPLKTETPKEEIDYSEDMEIIEDNSSHSSISQETVCNTPSSTNEHEEDSELLIIDDSQENHPEIKNEETNITQEEENNNVQKVITDYDENGEPVYSYVENVQQENLETIDSEVEFIEEKVIEPNEINFDGIENEPDLIEEIEEEETPAPADLSNDEIEDIEISENYTLEEFPNETLHEENIEIIDDTNDSKEIIEETADSSLSPQEDEIIGIDEETNLPEDTEPITIEEQTHSTIESVNEDNLDNLEEISPEEDEVEDKEEFESETIEDEVEYQEDDNNSQEIEFENETPENDEIIESPTDLYDNIAAQNTNMPSDNEEKESSYELADDILYDDENNTEETQNELNDDILDDSDEETSQTEQNEEDDEDEDEYDNDDGYDEDSEEDEEEDDDEEDEDDDDDEAYEYGEDDDENNKKLNKKSSSTVLTVIISVVVLLVIAGGGAFFFFNKNNSASSTISDNSIELSAGNEEETPPKQSIPDRGTIDVNALTEQDLIKVQPKRTSDSNKAIANAFSNGQSGVSLRGVNWLCNVELFTDKSFKAYLQELDSIFKMNFKKNILNATDSPSQDKMSVKLAVDKNGTLQRVEISESSGSEQIDDIVLQSIKETFEGGNTPIVSSESLKSDIYYMKLVIKI